MYIEKFKYGQCAARFKSFSNIRRSTSLTMPTHNPLQSADLCFTTLADNAPGAGKCGKFYG